MPPIDPLAPERLAVVIEDDPEIARLLSAVLTQAGFTCHAAGDGRIGLDLIRRHDPILTTLDVNLPGMDGFEVARRIRQFSNTYLIMLTARDAEIDTLLGLGAGADDYLTKPFRPRELRARVEAMLRRYGSQHAVVPAVDSDWLEHNGLRMHMGMRLVELGGVPVDLTRTEFDLLAALFAAHRAVVSKAALAQHVHGDAYGYANDSDERAIETHVGNLRRKLGDSTRAPRYVETVRGVGYRLAGPL